MSTTLVASFEIMDGGQNFHFENGKENFCRKFWENPEIYIKALNESALARSGNKNRFIRQEQYSKSLYCVCVEPNGSTQEQFPGLEGRFREFLIENRLVLLITGNTDHYDVHGGATPRCSDIVKRSKKTGIKLRGCFPYR